jgi:acyl-CoA synthetase (NDP forming)
MENQKALEIIKELINQSVKAGVMMNIETAVKVAEAFNTILKALENNASIETQID